MTRHEIELKFKEMALVYNRAHDFWHFPIGVDSFYQFKIRDLMNMGTGERPEKELQISIQGGPIAEAGWYMPDQGIKKIQILIKQMFEKTFGKLYGSETNIVWQWNQQFNAYRIATNSKFGKFHDTKRDKKHV